MINITMNSQGVVDRDSVYSVNNIIYGAVQADTVHSLNTRKTHSAGENNSVNQRQNSATNARQEATSNLRTGSSAHTGFGSNQLQTNPAPNRRVIPSLQHMVQKGQKVALEGSASLHTIKACLGWNTLNSQCDVDVSAFLLDNTGKVPGDDWFVFYGQTESPDGSTTFHSENSVDRESITILLNKLNPAIQKIVFVLTIHEALERNLHFGMVQDAYIRILNMDNQEELTSFKMDEYYTNVVSMMIGEIYKHNGVWKFNAVGNGVAKDLPGLCALYGVQVDD